MRTLSWIICLLALCLGCGDEQGPSGPRPPSGTPPPGTPPANTGNQGNAGNVATPPTLPPTSSNAEPYTVLESFDGRTVRGRVVWKGSAPAPLMLGCDKNTEICCSESTEKPAERLVIGPDGGVANAVVYLADITEGKDFPKGDAEMNQEQCRYTPHVVVGRRKEKFRMRSSDATLHNVHIYLGDQTVANISMPVPGVEKVVLDPGEGKTPAFYHLQCDAGHSWMNSWLVSTEHPYYVVTGEDGSFVLENVPDGVYTVTVWHEGWELVGTAKDPEGKVLSYEFSAPVVFDKEILVDGDDVEGLSFPLN